MDPVKAIRVYLDFFLLFFIFAKCQGRDSDSDYVTCGSLVKLLNTRHNVRLHSHDVKYGSGNLPIQEMNLVSYKYSCNQDKHLEHEFVLSV